MYRMYVHPERHKDIYDYMEGTKSPMRGEILRSAVRLYIYMQGNQLVGNINHAPESRVEAIAVQNNRKVYNHRLKSLRF